MKFFKLILLSFTGFLLVYNFIYLKDKYNKISGAYDIAEENATIISAMLVSELNLSVEEQFLNMFDSYLKMGAVTYYVIRDENGKLVYSSSSLAPTLEKEFSKDNKYARQSEYKLNNKLYRVTYGTDLIPRNEILYKLVSNEKDKLAGVFLAIIMVLIIVVYNSRKQEAKNILTNMLNTKSKKYSANGVIEKLENIYSPNEDKKVIDFFKSVESKRNKAEAEMLEYKENAYNGLNWAHEQIKKGITSANIAVGRSDINNYSVLVQFASKELVDFIKKAFFDRGGEYLNRYAGLKENSAGDDIVFFVPEKGSYEYDPRLVATHIIRGFFEIANDLNSEINNPNFRVTAKASIDFGFVEIEKLGGNAETEGLPFIYSERILKTVTEKNNSTLVILQESKESYNDHVEIKSEQEVNVKNYERPFRVVHIQNILGFHKSKINLKNLKYYRTDLDIVNILLHLVEITKNNLEEDFYLFYNHLNSFKISRTHKNVSSAYFKFLSACIESRNDKFLASAARLAKNIITTHVVTDEIINGLEKCAQSTDKRVISNSREAIYHLRPDIVNLNTLVNDPNNRIAANSLVELIKKDGLTDSHFEKMQIWLTTRDHAFKLSALYAYYTIFCYWVERRPEYVEVNENFNKIDRVIQKMDVKDKDFSRWISQYLEYKKEILKQKESA